MIDQYNLKIEDLSEHQTLLIGADYALLFSVRYGEVDFGKIIMDIRRWIYGIIVFINLILMIEWVFLIKIEII